MDNEKFKWTIIGVSIVVVAISAIFIAILAFSGSSEFGKSLVQSLVTKPFTEADVKDLVKQTPEYAKLIELIDEKNIHWDIQFYNKTNISTTFPKEAINALAKYGFVDENSYLIQVNIDSNIWNGQGTSPFYLFQITNAKISGRVSSKDISTIDYFKNAYVNSVTVSGGYFTTTTSK